MRRIYVRQVPGAKKGVKKGRFPHLRKFRGSVVNADNPDDGLISFFYILNFRASLIPRLAMLGFGDGRESKNMNQVESDKKL